MDIIGGPQQLLAIEDLRSCLFWLFEQSMQMEKLI